MSTEPPNDTSGLLRALWQKRAFTFAGIVANGSRDHREIAHAAALISEDYHDRFLVELVQNANDQALLGNTPGSTVVVVRSEHLVAVSNGGQVVTARNLERISSLADSDKSGLLVGNKGVGFKAVYQVTDRPEVYSAPEDDGEASVLDRLAVAFALERQPFENAALREAVESDIRVFFAENGGLARRLSAAGHGDPITAILPELEKVAGFKFPANRTRADLVRHLEALQFPEDLRPTARTLVVLPLRDDLASQATERVVNAFVGEGTDGYAQAELAVLFLSGISRIEVVDHVRKRRWSFSCERETGGEIPEASVVVRQPDGIERTSRYWTTSADVFDCDDDVVGTRRELVNRALQQFGLEAWSPDDPLHVTVALPQPTAGEVGPLGPSGRFCLGLPTQQSTGLPAHVDARFFAKINRDGVNFDQREGYNGLLLDVATEVFGNLLARLRASLSLETRRAATLALHKPKDESGPLAERVYAAGGIADGEVVLTWDGHRFCKRSECALPSVKECALLPLVDDALPSALQEANALPERGLVMHALDALQSMKIRGLNGIATHAWLAKAGEGRSIVEEAARLHREDGSEWWESFVGALLRTFTKKAEVEALRDQSWLPTGETDLSMPSASVFLPALANAPSDDDEATDVPPRVAARLRLLDATKMRLREGGRALTPLASRLVEGNWVRRPLTRDLLEGALFPTLVDAVQAADESLALDLFAQAVAWIASMKGETRRDLNTGKALIPVRAVGRLRWLPPGDAYCGEGWGLDGERERLLATAYPESRVIPLSELTPRLGLPSAGDAALLRVAETLRLESKPRVLELTLPNPSPLTGAYGELTLVESPTCNIQEANEFLDKYFRHLCVYRTTAKYRAPHGVSKVLWIDGLERDGSRRSIFDLILAHPQHYATYATTHLTKNRTPEHVVPTLWAYSVCAMDWPLVPVERGVGGEETRVPTTDAWILTDSSRRTAFAKIVNVVPQRFAGASDLLQKCGVYTVDNAPVKRLLRGLELLARRLEQEHLDVHRDALSLARELYSQIEERDDADSSFPSSVPLPLLRDGRLVAVAADDDAATVLFDDDPSRTKHIPGAATAYRVPVRRDAKVDRLFGMFVGLCGGAKVIRASTAAIDLGFKPEGDTTPEDFLAWLDRVYPRAEVAIELAVLLTHSGNRTLRTERISRNWSLFQKLKIEFGTFAGATIKSFYDRLNNRLSLTTSLKGDFPGVVAATWEVAGARSRDLWDGYARALRDSTTRAFLRDRDITEIEEIEVADAAGLHRSQSIEGVECALLASYTHLGHGSNLNAAATWWAHVERTPRAVAESLGRPDLAPEIEDAIRLPQPEGEVLLVQFLGLPWSSWHAAVKRRDGRIFRFAQSEARFREVLAHLVAVVREIAVHTGNTDLDAVGTILDAALQEQAPDNVAGVPLEITEADQAALDTILHRLDDDPDLGDWLKRLPRPPWRGELPVPNESPKVTKRGVLLYRDQSAANRQSEAKGTIEAVLAVAADLAPILGESINPKAVAMEPSVAQLTAGTWSNVYAALAALREVLLRIAPSTVTRLAKARAFHGPTRTEPLRAKLQELANTRPAKPPPKVEVLGVQLSDAEVRDDLASGSAGRLGSRLVEAAAAKIPDGLLEASRRPLPRPTAGGGGSSGGRGGPSGGEGGTGGRRIPTREPGLIGDLGEAFVHEWLTLALGEHYGPESWKSRARERYGFPGFGDDGLGYDFDVLDPAGNLFPGAPSRVYIEVKSTQANNFGPFQMSRNEWDTARRCHAAHGGPLYVIVRVFQADTTPYIGDLISDPFDAYQRDEVRLLERDFWVTVAPPDPSPRTSAIESLVDSVDE